MKKLVFSLLALAGVASATVNYPYPQNSTYNGRGIQASTITDATLKSKFSSWYSTFYTESGNYARVKFDDPTFTVSEGIGYGMLAMVYFSDATTSHEPEFKKLWAYYQNWVNSAGLMNWKINGFSSVDQSNGATDADVDVALALLQGYYQFGNAQYLADAKSLIAKIRIYEIDGVSLLKPGDAWNDKKNPSYYAPAAMELFKANDAAGAATWTSALAANYAMLAINSGSNGLVTDWANSNGSVNGTDQYGYESVRNPWRYALAYYWFGHSDAKTLLDKMGSWASSKYGTTGSAIRGPLTASSGNATASDNNSVFTGSIACGMVSTSGDQALLNSAATKLMTYSGESYFNASLQLLYGLTISGNMPNLAAGGTTTSSSSTTTSSSSTTSSSASTGYIIDNLEDGNYSALWGGEWFTYKDSGDGGASVVTPLTSKIVKFTPTASPTNGTSYAAKINYTLNVGDLTFDPYIGIGVNMRADAGNHDLTSCTTLQYDYIGSAHRFRVQTSDITDAGYFGFANVAASAWTTVTLTWADLAQESWALTANLTKSKVTSWTWQIQAATGTTGTLSIDNVKCIGGVAPSSNSASSSSTTTVSSSSVTTVSSSSKASSSSVAVSSSAKVSSSSVAVSSSAKASSSSVTVVSSSSAVVLLSSSAVSTGTAIIPGRIQAESYNAQSGTAIKTTSDVDGSIDVTELHNGDWLDYSVDVQTAGNYTLNVRANTSTGFALQISGFTGGYMSIPSTNGAWSTATASSIWLNAGTGTMRLTVQGSGATSAGDLNWIEFVGGSSSSTNPSSSSTVSSSSASAVLTVGSTKYSATQGADLQLILSAGHPYRTATFYDILGHEVGGRNVQGLNSVSFPVKKAGLYFVRLNGNGVSTTLRITAR